MTLSEFRQRLKLQVPNMNQNGVSDTFLDLLINQACDKANMIAKVYKGYTDFNIEADKRLYDFANYVPGFLGTDKRGVYFKDSNDDWEHIWPKTEKQLRRVYPNYLNATSVSVPNWYYFSDDDSEKGPGVAFYPPPSTTKSSGGRIYHLKKANYMTAGSHYPFSGSNTELISLRPLDDAIVAYCVWKISPSFGAVTDKDLRKAEFIAECKDAARQIRRRQDVSGEPTNKMRI